MRDIYKECIICIVVHGGLGRLVELNEETAWIYRSWMLQEALSPKTIKCLFRWGISPAEFWGVTEGNIEGVEENHSAMMSLNDLVITTYFNFQEEQITVKILGGEREPIMALNGAMNLENRDGQEVAIWRCALMRTSKKEIDIVFSIMGLFGVNNPESRKLQ
jgi:hypothetical protein